ncbi:MAG: hypothetical protein QM398_07385 [Thermoproteota archaeon]|nr:hypothetical protein [Thermoproteota archaeon]
MCLKRLLDSSNQGKPEEVLLEPKQLPAAPPSTTSKPTVIER